MKPASLLPQFNDRKNRWETSVFRTTALRSKGVWRLGYLFAERSDRVIKAKGEGAFSWISDQSLVLDVNAEPYPRHVDIVGWTDIKHERLHLATQIANRMKLHVNPRDR